VCDVMRRKHFVVVLAIICLLTVMPLQAALEDPTRPPTANASMAVSPKKNYRPRWVLTSTLVSAQRHTAVINNKVVSRGDRVNGARVVSIQPSTVRLRVGGRDITLVMLKKNIKSLSRTASLGQGK